MLVLLLSVISDTFLRGFGGMMPLFLFILIFYITNIYHMYIYSTFILHHSLSPHHLFIAGQHCGKDLPGDPVPSIEFEPALQQADALPTELPRTLF
jgi:hypothetical protein